jgi:3-hydroxyisobutyrate dehydrogenase-like beta-hydroxyacid dehydrogenase
MTVTRPSVGLIGIGLLGEAFACRLVEAGMDVVGHDIDPARRAVLTGLGGRFAALPELAGCSTIVVAVFSTDQVEGVVEQILAARAGDQDPVVLCASTCDPDRIAALAAHAASSGLALLETPVSGTSEQVRRGEGVGLIGGEMTVAKRVERVLEVLFPRRFHIGRAGDGGRAKLAINLILGLNRLALAEGLVFAERVGLDPEAFLPVARASAAYSQAMDTKGAKMTRRDFAPQGRARQHLKDVHLILAQARKAGLQLPLSSLHAEVLEACLQAGEGDLDNSVVIEEIRRRSARDGG